MAPYFVRWIIWKTRTTPLLIISEVLWVLLSGWALFLSYVLGAVALLCSLIFIPFIPAILKIAWFALDPIRFQAPFNKEDRRILHYYKSPFVILANVVWAVLFGWGLFLFHMVLALIQALTIFGIGNALKNFQISLVALFPFGRVILPQIAPERPVREQQVTDPEMVTR